MELMARGPMRSLVDGVLGTDEKMRRRLLRTLMVVPVYGVCVVLLKASAAWGLADQVVAHWSGVAALAGPLCFYLLIRSRVSERLRDPSMVMAQMLFGLSGLMAGYVIAAPVRSAALVLVALLMSFGAFRLTPRQAWTLCGAAIALAAVVMTIASVSFPARFPPYAEAINFSVVAAVLPTLAALTSQTHSMSTALRQRRDELQLALHSVEILAMHDGLTELVNRRRLQTLLDEALAREARDPQGLCVILIDIDHFKRINDAHGHAGGDWVLKRFAHLANSALRATDTLGRWGGEEFLLLLPATGIDEARVVYDRLAQRLHLAANWSEQPDRQVTVSAGLVAHEIGDSAARLVERADLQLYAAKAAGRNCLRWA